MAVGRLALCPLRTRTALLTDGYCDVRAYELRFDTILTGTNFTREAEETNGSNA